MAGFTVLHAADAHWRPSNLRGVANAQLVGPGAPLGARLWRLAPGQFGTWHRHQDEHELYVLLEGTGRLRVGDETLTLAPLGAVLVEPATMRQLFNDTDADALWLAAGAPRDVVDDPAWHYPDGAHVPPPELA